MKNKYFNVYPNKIKYFGVYPPDPGYCSVVLATNADEAKRKFVKGDVIPFFQGWDNGDFDLLELNARRLKFLDPYKPDDDFDILKNLILKDGWGFATIDEPYKSLDKSNYSDDNLRQYLMAGNFYEKGDE